MPKLTYRSDDLIPAESRKLPTWLSTRNNMRRQRELLTMLRDVQQLGLLSRLCREVEAYDSLMGKLQAIQDKVHRFGAVLYPGRRRRER